MNDDSKNKVCFDCAGVPVIRRIVMNMKAGGVTRFVIVVGHKAQSVMDALDGMDGVVYAYQREQKGTGHAALCGLKALSDMGCDGAAVVSMGDKIIAPEVISRLLTLSREAKAVWGVQPISANPGGGRVVLNGNNPCGVVELADAALMSLAGVKKEHRRESLLSLGLNEKKITAVLKKADEKEPESNISLCGKSFSAQEILSAAYANAGLYCFDIKSAVTAIASCNSSNAQGEIYLTDTLEYFAGRNEAKLYTVERAEDMLTYSTKPELRRVSEYFMRSASEMITDIESKNMNTVFSDIYGEAASEKEERCAALLRHFISRFGDKKVVVTRAPGRVNLMGRHIDHRGGSINVMAVDRDTVFVCSPRTDDIVNYTNIDSRYKDGSFSIGEYLSEGTGESWLEYLSDKNVVARLENSRGDWSNYIKSAVLRFAFDNAQGHGHPLCGMDIAVCGDIPEAAGLSSSSSIVVACAEAVTALNSMNITDREFIDLCGEGEWFVGSRGGAGDHAAMKCARRGQLIHLGFKPFTVGESAPLSDKYAVIVADSGIKAKKSEGSKDKFNAKVASYEFALLLIKRAFPDYDLHEFRDIAKITPASAVYKMLLTLPEKATSEQIYAMLPDNREYAQKVFSTHADAGEYELRGVALYGASECARAEMFQEILESGDCKLLGELMKISHDGDRVSGADVSDEKLRSLARDEAPLYLQSGAYRCSTEKIDGLSDLLNSLDGVVGSEIVGAGLGGCVVALVERSLAQEIIARIDRDYYDKYGFAHAASVYLPSSGSAVIY